MKQAWMIDKMVPPNTNSKLKRRGHLAGLDILRGLAAVLVVCYHLWNRFNPGGSSQSKCLDWNSGQAYDIFFFLFQYGYLGVALFFVLSGFCIHYAYASKFDYGSLSKTVISSYLRKRFWRLYPAYFVSMLFSSFALGFYPVLNFLIFSKEINFYEAFNLPYIFQNALFLQLIYPDSLDFNGVYWTLLYEVQFYILYPFLLILCRRFGFGTVLLILLGCEVYFAYNPLPIHLFFTRYFEWFIGMHLAEYLMTNGHAKITFKSLALIIGLPLAIISTFTYSIYPLRDIFASIGFLGALWCIIAWNPAKDLMSNSLLMKLAVNIGLISYSLYLIHVPVIDLTWNTLTLVHKYLPVGDFSYIKYLSFVAIGLSLLFARFLYRKIEIPFMRQQSKYFKSLMLLLKPNSNHAD